MMARLRIGEVSLTTSIGDVVLKVLDPVMADYPMLGSQLASTSLSLTTVLLIGGGLRLAAGGLIPFDLVGRGKRHPHSAPAAPD